jgi:hypothetical protein
MLFGNRIGQILGGGRDQLASFQIWAEIRTNSKPLHNKVECATAFDALSNPRQYICMESNQSLVRSINRALIARIPAQANPVTHSENIVQLLTKVIG